MWPHARNLFLLLYSCCRPPRAFRVDIHPPFPGSPISALKWNTTLRRDDVFDTCSLDGDRGECAKQNMIEFRLLCHSVPSASNQKNGLFSFVNCNSFIWRLCIFLVVVRTCLTFQLQLWQTSIMVYNSFSILRSCITTQKPWALSSCNRHHWFVCNVHTRKTLLIADIPRVFFLSPLNPLHALKGREIYRWFSGECTRKK